MQTSRGNRSAPRLFLLPAVPSPRTAGCCSLPAPIAEMLCSLRHLHSPPPDPLCSAHVPPVLQSPEPCPALPARPHSAEPNAGPPRWQSSALCPTGGHGGDPRSPGAGSANPLSSFILLIEFGAQVCIFNLKIRVLRAMSTQSPRGALSAEEERSHGCANKCVS